MPAPSRGDPGASERYPRYGPPLSADNSLTLVRLSASTPLSKLALNGLTLMLAKALQGDRIAVNSTCPGWVRTEMGGPTAPRSVEEGADTAVRLATEAPLELTGKFFRDREEIPW